MHCSNLTHTHAHARAHARTLWPSARPYSTPEQELNARHNCTLAPRSYADVANTCVCVCVCVCGKQSCNQRVLFGKTEWRTWPRVFVTGPHARILSTWLAHGF